MSRRAATGLTSAVLLVGALAFGVPALLVPGAALAVALLTASGYVAVLGHRARLLRTPVEQSAVEGDRVVLTLRVAGRRALLRSGEIAPAPGAPFRPRRWLEGDDLRIVVTVGRRGSHEFAPSLLRVRDPFGLCEALVQSDPAHVLALPRCERLQRSLLARLRADAAAGRRPAGAIGDVDGVRPAEAGVPAPRVHWPTVARTGALAERVIAPEFDRGPLVVLDTRGAVDAEREDAAVRAAASLTLALASEGGARLLVCDETAAWSIDERLAAWPRALERLASLRGGRTIAWSVVESAPVVIWVAADHVARRPAGARRTPDFIVTPGAGPGIAVVGGCTVRPGAHAEVAA
jgi:uncharacterized protein (DUF58 family)